MVGIKKIVDVYMSSYIRSVCSHRNVDVCIIILRFSISDTMIALYKERNATHSLTSVTMTKTTNDRVK